MRRNLTYRERYLLGAAGLGQDEAVALVERKAAAQVGQGEGRLAIAAVGGSDQLEQGLMLGDGQELALAEHPADRREVAGKHADLAHIRLCHGASPLGRRGEDALQGDAEAQGQERLHVEVHLAPAGIGDRRRAQRNQPRRRVINGCRIRQECIVWASTSAQ
jgi:hypothetical protein